MPLGRNPEPQSAQLELIEMPLKKDTQLFRTQEILGYCRLQACGGHLSRMLEFVR